jgi:hypothetical protein
MGKLRIAQAAIYSPDGTVNGTCHGPTWSGGCEKTAPGQPVACAGRTIVAKGIDGAEIVLTVAAGARSCPLAAFSPALAT